MNSTDHHTARAELRDMAESILHMTRDARTFSKHLSESVAASVAAQCEALDLRANAVLRQLDSFEV
jgi:phosphate uptake regulator